MEPLAVGVSEGLQRNPRAGAPLDGLVATLQSVVLRVADRRRVVLVVGEIVVDDRLVDPNVVAGDGRTALVLLEDQVLMAIPLYALYEVSVWIAWYWDRQDRRKAQAAAAAGD